MNTGKAKIKKKVRSGVVTLSRKIGKDETLNAIELDIVQKGEIPGLGSLQIRGTSLSLELAYQTLSDWSFAAFLGSGQPFWAFLEIVWRIVKTVEGCESFGIKSGNLELRPEYIFINPDSGEPTLLLWPVVSLGESQSVQNYLRDYGTSLVSLPGEESLREQYLAFFYDRKDFDIFEFEKLLLTLIGGPTEIPAVSGETAGVVLRDAYGGGNILPDRFPFTLGRDPAQCDYAFQADDRVSRRHFTLILQDGILCGVDEGSTNGTKIDGVPLAAGVLTSLSVGSVIQIGRQELILEQMRS